MKTLLVKVYSCLFRNVTTKINQMIHEAIFKTNVDTMDQFTNYLYVVVSFF